MTRRLAAAALVLLLPIGMAACSSQSKADACAEIEKARNAVLEQSDSLDSTTDADDFRSKMDLSWHLQGRRQQCVQQGGVGGIQGCACRPR